jgi:basic membrane protein A and related proteins
MTLTRKLFGATALATLFAGAALADPAMIYDMGGKFDKSFNEAAWNGAERWAAETGGTYRDIEMQSEAQREQALRRMAEGGSNPVVMTGFSFMSILSEVAPDYPDTTFVIIDGVVDAPNVRSVVFTEHEGSYLVGMAAAMASQTGVVSFVGGMDIPLIRRFACGYVQGARAYNPTIGLIVNYTGTTPAAWNDPVRGGEITEAQINQQSDVVFAAAGGTGVGVLQTAADRGILSIGVDSNQNFLHPGSVLTSMLKRVDNAVYNAMTEGPGMETGIHVMNLASGGVGWALDEHNDALITPAMRTALAEAEARIVAGETVVHDYMSDDSCPISVN